VYNEDEKQYVGFLDMRDFVSFVVFFYHGEAEDGYSFVNIMREGLKSFNTPVEGITVSCMCLSSLSPPSPPSPPSPTSLLPLLPLSLCSAFVANAPLLLSLTFIAIALTTI
jgi:hypothetical protein